MKRMRGRDQVRTRETAHRPGGGPAQRRRDPADASRDKYEENDKYEEDDEYEDEEDEDSEPLSPSEVARSAARHVAALTGKELRGVVSLERAEFGWSAGVEMVEDRRIPSSNDVLGLYLTEVDAEGNLLSYRRSRRYARGRGDSGEGALA